MAERNSPRLHGAAASTERVAARAETTRAYANPSIEVFAGHQSAKPVPLPGPPGLLQHYAAYQPIEIPSERHARQRAASLAVDSSKLAEQGVALSVVAEVKRAFYKALQQREEIRHAQENLQLVEGLRRRVEAEVNVGEIGRLELTRAEAELARARFVVNSAQIEYANALAMLRMAIAAPADAELNPQGSLEDRITLLPLKELSANVLGAHPLLAQSKTDIQVAQATFDRERAARIPQPTAFVEYEDQPDLRSWRTGVSINIPLWDHRRGQVHEARAAIIQSNTELDQRRLILTASLERAYEQYQLADQQVISLESGSLRAAESAVDAAQAAYRFGERGILEVLDAQRVLQNVRGDLLDAQYSRQSARIDLEEIGAVAPDARP